jgi:hypothetical protein
VKAVLIILLVVAALVGGLMTLRSSRGTGMPGEDVIKRAKERERDQEARDEHDADR